MEIRDVLVHVPDPGAWPRHLAHAAQIARHFGARLTGMQVIEPYPQFAVPDAPAVTIALQEQIRVQVKRAHEGAVPFGERVAALGLDASACAWKVAEGDIARALAYAGAWHDVLVLGAVADNMRSSPHVVAKSVIESTMPCLVVPEAAADRPFAMDNIAIAWNGSIEALRAIHSALPLLRAARRVLVLRGRARDYSASMPQPPSFDIDMYLSRHDVRPEIARVDTSDTEAGRALIERALAERADLIVMGAYGRTRFSEWVLGGATRDAIWHGSLPLYLHH